MHDFEVEDVLQPLSPEDESQCHEVDDFCVPLAMDIKLSIIEMIEHVDISEQDNEITASDMIELPHKFELVYEVSEHIDDVPNQTVEHTYLQEVDHINFVILLQF
ncbi:hypothetical protein O6P43_005513 [Quillaja saponaria]|uniref:Uncharacterized protein n=1 Tax=Quillaja saponaria TaxID=32244 RepID=A0AAD7Q665_QUISA|nr:hypothetical protein O6P43_005513 [Quillaja saponaria]